MNQELWPQQIWECESPDCGLRFPVRKDEPRARSCPLCESRTNFVEEFTRPPASQEKPSRGTTSEPAAEPGATSEPGGLRGRGTAKNVAAKNLTFVLDNIRSANNVGSIIRTADAVGASIVLGGFTATPDNPKVGKTALGADESVRWSSNRNSLQAVEQLQQSGTTVWALEVTPTSVEITSVDLPDGPLAIVVGNEVSGVDPGILRAVPVHVHLPMVGVKTSLNVAVAMGAAAYLLGRPFDHG